MSGEADEQNLIGALIAAIQTRDDVQHQGSDPQEQAQQQHQEQQEQQEEEQSEPDAMDLPVKRFELIQAMQMIQLVLLSHSAHDAARILGDEDRISETGAKAVEHTLEIGLLAKDMVTRWKEEDVR